MLQQLETLLRYVFALSAALAMLNMLPVPYLDGQHVMDMFALRSHTIRLAAPLIKYLSTALLIANMAIAFFKTFSVL